MNIKNKPATFFAIIILLFLAFVLYMGMHRTEVVIQAGHEGKIRGNTGGQTKQFREVDWNILVADEVARHLVSWGIEVKRVPAKVSLMKANITVSIHFDAAKNVCGSGASVGYPNTKSKQFAQQWKALYKDYFPFTWHKDNFTKNLSNYYAYKWIRSEKFLVLELGELTCKKQTKWLKPRLKKIAHLVAYSIAKELGKDVKKPTL